MDILAWVYSLLLRGRQILFESNLRINKFTYCDHLISDVTVNCEIRAGNSIICIQFYRMSLETNAKRLFILMEQIISYFSNSFLQSFKKVHLKGFIHSFIMAITLGGYRPGKRVQSVLNFLQFLGGRLIIISYNYNVYSFD